MNKRKRITKDKQMTVRMSEQLKERLDALGQQTGADPTNIAHVCVLDRLHYYETRHGELLVAIGQSKKDNK